MHLAYVRSIYAHGKGVSLMSQKDLIFLDIDGVLHPVSGGVLLVDSCFTALAAALSDFDVHVVVSSTWRETYDLEELKAILKPINKPVVGVTPIVDDPFLPHVRFHEVRQYLADHNSQGRKWAAIDDSRGFYPPMANVYWTDPRRGFVAEDIRGFKEFFQGI